MQTFPDSAKDTSYYRVDSSNVVMINFKNDDYVYADFKRPEGEEWESHSNYFGYVNKRNLMVNVDAGTFYNVIEIYIDNRMISDVLQIKRYAPNVGLIELMVFRRILVLVSAIVNGVSYL